MLTSAFLLSSSTTALADPIAVKKADAAAVQAQLDALGQKAEVASEQYNAARDNYVALTARVRATEAQIAQLHAHTNALQTALNTTANSMYRDDSPLDVVQMLLGARTIEEFNSTVEFMTSVSEQNASTVTQLKRASVQAAIAQRNLLVAQASARAQQQAMAASKQAVTSQIAAQTKVLAGITADIRSLVAAQQAAVAAAARARAASLLGGNGGSGVDLGGDPPPSSKGASAVRWAEKEFGKPYQWAAAGPDSFDCSGLMLWAYAHVGISLPHYSGSQFVSGPHVSRSNLQPGDLVFFGSPIHHVGMYVGGGDFIEAPYTGADVRISSLAGRDDYAGAPRPQ